MELENRAGAWHLMEQTTESGWTVVKPVGWDPATGASTDIYNGSGGNFSVAYLVEKDGKQAFLKAIDLTPALTAHDVAQQLQDITAAHSFETEILRICQGDRMDRVVVAIESGQIRVGPNLQDTAPYLIFELADGDVRRRIQKVSGSMRTAWWLRAMHHTAVGMNQLHGRNIAHQDLKPSNVLSFGETADFRVADLGRAVCSDTVGPYDDMIFSGDMGYAPPEITYGFIEPDVQKRRFCNDAYLFGSMIFFYLQGLGCTPLLMRKLDKKLWPRAYGGGWADSFRTAVPYLQTAFTELLEDTAITADTSVSVELLKAASELCNPDPFLRGHPMEKNASSNQFSLQRYVAQFDLMATKAEIATRAHNNND